jgi:UDP-N-acetylmuramoyl-tripeptide--D-alanyl-D-alanine ligase
VDEIALAKRELIEGLVGPDSVAVLNADDPRVAGFAGVAPGRIVTFGLSSGADFRAENIDDRGMEGTEFDFVGPTGRVRLTLPLAGRHNISNALAALAAASVWSVGAVEAKEVFPQLKPEGMRGLVLRYREGFSVINDSYNSNPAALAAMIDVVRRTPVSGRCILVAGEMLELGPDSAQLHEKAGESAADIGVFSLIVGVQGDARSLIRGAEMSEDSAPPTKFFASSDEAADFLVDFIEPGDLLLVKGSRGVKMERIIEALDAHFKRWPPAQMGKVESGGTRERG